MSNYLGFTPTTESLYYFVSYNNEDAERVSPLACAMDDAGIPLWYDYGLILGKQWEYQISLKIANSQAVFILFTKGIMLKEESFVQKEYKIAKELKKNIIVLFMEEVTRADVPDWNMSWWVDIKDRQNMHLYKLKSTEEKISEIKRALKMANMRTPAGQESISGAYEKEQNRITDSETTDKANPANLSERSYVYASYSYKDKNTVFPIVFYLANHGTHILLYENAKGSEKRNAQKVQNCDAMISFISDHFFDSADSVSDLLSMYHYKEILPVYLDHAKLPDNYPKQIQQLSALRINQFDDRKSFYSELLQWSGIQRNIEPPRSDNSGRVLCPYCKSTDLFPVKNAENAARFAVSAVAYSETDTCRMVYEIEFPEISNSQENNQNSTLKPKSLAGKLSHNLIRNLGTTKLHCLNCEKTFPVILSSVAFYE